MSTGAGGVNVFGCGCSVAIVLGLNLLKRALCSGQQRRFVAPHESERDGEGDAAEDETATARGPSSRANCSPAT